VSLKQTVHVLPEYGSRLSLVVAEIAAEAAKQHRAKLNERFLRLISRPDDIKFP
jgi:hypothetical protein